MKIGKLELNSKGWFWNGMGIHNPIRILWNLAIVPFYFLVLFLFCVVKVLITLDVSYFKDTWKTHSP